MIQQVNLPDGTRVSFNWPIVGNDIIEVTHHRKPNMKSIEAFRYSTPAQRLVCEQFLKDQYPRIPGTRR